ncbi:MULTISPECIES: hypothetical protein [unclassified Pseudonocardia]|uniref:hypothetical protein n=1 Tax=unclassified Pseudonocardia TaxID=2619320 RepID=UPI0001FFE048|nr:hypothetical protein [Pseudonocardia sp. Ae707_Ps1]OLM17914.1 hypothetical protein Ae707Ps1_2173 [Pseudonocardia sp. Ae707_Ps1]
MNLWERDAERAGQIDRGDKSYVAMLAARCVEEGAGQTSGLINSTVAKNFATGKVSCREFARRSGISDPTVAAYLRTWDALAADGWVPSRDSLNPGDEDVADLPDRETWNKYYRAANPAVAANGGKDDAPEWHGTPLDEREKFRRRTIDVFTEFHIALNKITTQARDFELHDMTESHLVSLRESVDAALERVRAS